MVTLGVGVLAEPNFLVKFSDPGNCVILHVQNVQKKVENGRNRPKMSKKILCLESDEMDFKPLDTRCVFLGCSRGSLYSDCFT